MNLSRDFSTRPTELSDSDILPFREGKYAGQRLGDIPDSYWRWFLKQDWCDRWPQLVEYANLCVDMSSVEDS